MRRLSVVLLVLAALLGAGIVDSARAMWLDPAFTGGGGAPSPPQAGIALTGGRFSDPGVLAFGDATPMTRTNPTTLAAPVEAMAATPDGHGYWMASAAGEVLGFGDATVHGWSAKTRLSAPIVAMAANADGDGYWLADLNGGVYAFGDAQYFGSMNGHAIPAPIVAMAATPDGRGYWLLGEDGTTYHFGDAHQFGFKTNAFAPMVSMTPTADGQGYWEVGSDGGVFSFGDAHYYGSMGTKPIYGSVVSIAATTDGKGYWIAGDDGAVYSFGDAHFLGSNATQVPTPAVAAIVPTVDDQGYWLLDPNETPSAFSAYGAVPSGGRAEIVHAAATQLGGNPRSGFYCNLYGPCEEWCSLFATWTWDVAGLGIPRYAFTGDAYDWAAKYTAVLPPTAKPAPGDLVFYGSGPGSTYSSLHVGVIAEVFPDGALITIDGDSGPGPNGSANVIVNGPFLPAFSKRYNGMNIYGYGVA